MSQTIIYTLKELPEVADRIVTQATSKTLLFYGDMGVGKTTLIKELAKLLHVQDRISSPTFSIVNEYATLDGKLYHFDFYRIENEVEAMDIGIEEYFYSGHWNFIEWPEKINNLLPKNHQKIILSMNADTSRSLIIC